MRMLTNQILWVLTVTISLLDSNYTSLVAKGFLNCLLLVIIEIKIGERRYTLNLSVINTPVKKKKKKWADIFKHKNVVPLKIYNKLEHISVEQNIPEADRIVQVLLGCGDCYLCFMRLMTRLVLSDIAWRNLWGCHKKVTVLSSCPNQSVFKNLLTIYFAVR